MTRQYTITITAETVDPPTKAWRLELTDDTGGRTLTAETSRSLADLLHHAKRELLDADRQHTIHKEQ